MKAPRDASAAERDDDGRGTAAGVPPNALPEEDALARAAADQAARERRARADPEPSLGARLGQIGLLGWTIVTPTLVATFVGRRLDRALASGILFSAALTMLGAALGLWLAWRWMQGR